MAEAVVSIALATLRDLLLEQGRFLSNVRGEVESLRMELKEIQCLLKDADRRQQESQSVVNWIAQIRDLARRAEETIETHAFRVSLNRRRSFKQLLHGFSCARNQGFSLHRIGSEISAIRSHVGRVNRSMQEYGIRSIIQGETSTADPGDNQRWKRQTFPFEIEDCFVGKDEELKRLLSLIVDNKQYRVISVWGMGGIGKTTIARKVYNHNETKRWFESLAWVCITQKCQIRSVLEDILKQLIPQKRNGFSSLSDIELIGQLCQIQRAKRCLIVLDDLWETNHWDGLKQAFIAQGLNSKILLTTRKQIVVDVGFAFRVGFLNLEDGWELLKMKAFPHGIIPDTDYTVKDKILVEKVGKEMVRKCGSLPIVISLLGGILSKRKYVEEWEVVNENIKAHIYWGKEIEEEKKKIEIVLDLSYDDLPYYLKPCFLYMGLIRENQRMGVNTLYRLWIAEGMISQDNIQGKRDQSLIDIAELYLSELVLRCLVQVQVEDFVPELNYRSCQLHDVVRELCLMKCNKEDLCLQVMDYRGGNFSKLFYGLLSGVNTRHLAIHFDREIEVEHCKITVDSINIQHVRSLWFLNELHGKKMALPHTVVDFHRLKLLRVLVFRSISFVGRKLPRGIGNLIHLRYLCFRNCELDELPWSISNLAYLYTLDLLDSWDVRVPNVLKKMLQLKHLILPSYNQKNVGHYRLRLEDLDELETLYGFNSLVHDFKSLTRMKNLRRLSATVHDNESLSAIISAVVTNWKNLRFWGLTIQHGCEFRLTDEGLVMVEKVFTCPNLRSLKINVHLGKLLEECASEIIKSRLVFLVLSECEIENDPMEILGRLQFLEELSLFERSFVGEEMRCHALSFPRLKKLELVSLPKLTEWRVEQGAMPLLSEIEIRDCLCLETIPDGLRFIPTLQKLTISGMPRLEKRVSNEGGQDFDKVRHVPSLVVLGKECK